MAWSDWTGAIGVVSGVAVTSVFGLITVRLTHRWQRRLRSDERRQARGDLRRDAYAAFLIQTQKMIDDVSAWMDSTGSALAPPDRVAAFARDLGTCSHERDSCERRAKLVAGSEVRRAIGAYGEWFRGACAEAVREEQPGFSVWEKHENKVFDAMAVELDADMTVPEEQPSWIRRSWRRLLRRPASVPA
ncbi:hypothetical protein ACFQ80_10900 [Isoptericola sp. NPDC056578]|uniref:hypothetical protein n=1 Tax=Isoptericola sp. NPDC056578 TaxID=3345870 RepID=UPI00367463A3